MKATLSCSRVVPLLDAFVDGELPQETILEVEQHLAECKKCDEWVHFTHALQNSTRRSVRDDAHVTPALFSRIQGALVEERELAAATERVRPLGWRAILPLAAAAAAVVVWAGLERTVRQPQPSAAQLASDEMNLADSDQAIEEVIDKLIDYHSAPPSTKVMEPTLVSQFDRDVGVRVHLPSFSGSQLVASPAQFEWEGATVVPVRNQRAAYLRYKVSGHQVTVYMYNARQVPVHRRLEPRRVHNLPVYVGESRGYSIAARENKGIGYAVATDLNEVESAELVAAIH